MAGFAPTFSDATWVRVPCFRHVRPVRTRFARVLSSIWVCLVEQTLVARWLALALCVAVHHKRGKGACRAPPARSSRGGTGTLQVVSWFAQRLFRALRLDVPGGGHECCNGALGALAVGCGVIIPG